MIGEIGGNGPARRDGGADHGAGDYLAPVLAELGAAEHPERQSGGDSPRSRQSEIGARQGRQDRAKRLIGSAELPDIERQVIDNRDASITDQAALRRQRRQPQDQDAE